MKTVFKGKLFRVFVKKVRLPHGFVATYEMIKHPGAALIVPFLTLLARGPKRNLPVLAGISVWILAMHWVDLHWVVMPTVHKHGFHWNWMDVATWVAAGSAFALAFWGRLKSRALAPVGDPRFEQGLGFRNV